jgi:hypothetical protein
MSDIIRAVTNPLGLIVLVQLLTFACLQSLARGKNSKQVRRVSYFAFGFSFAVLALAATLYLAGKGANTPSVVRVRIVDAEGKPVSKAALALGEAGLLKPDQKGELDVPLSFFASGSVQRVQIVTDDLEGQPARLNAGDSGVQTLTLSASKKQPTATKHGTPAK